jgi:hypothetical protein
MKGLGGGLSIVCIGDEEDIGFRIYSTCKVKVPETLQKRNFGYMLIRELIHWIFKARLNLLY